MNLRSDNFQVDSILVIPIVGGYRNYHTESILVISRLSVYGNFQISNRSGMVRILNSLTFQVLIISIMEESRNF